MESVSTTDANRFLATTKYLFEVNQLCYGKCVVDFQTKDLSAMEKECALACLKKHMTIFKDITGQQQSPAQHQ